VRATISQIGKYITAANTLKGKYGELPGDVDNNTAMQFGFALNETGSNKHLVGRNIFAHFLH
jgi:hypothetical protein